MERERPERTAGSKTRAFIVAKVGNGNVSKYLHAIVRHRGEGRKEGSRSDRSEVSAELATKHRAAVTRVVFLAQDRLDLGVAAVELAKTMAILRERDDERLRRVAIYLHGHPDYLQWYPFQEDTDAVGFDHGCRLGYMQGIASVEFRRNSAVGESSHRRVQSCSITHCCEFW